MRWLFADQLGPHFLDTPDQTVLLIESRAVFRRRRFHRRKAHLVLSALRHRALDPGGRATLVRADTYGEGLAQVGGPLTVVQPTSWAADRYVRARPEVVDVLPARGFVTSREDFADWARGRGRRRLLMEDFYRDARRRTGVLMDGAEPAGGRWNLDADNRRPPPRDRTDLGVPPPYRPHEDEVDEEVRADLDRWERDEGVEFLGEDGPRRFAVTRAEALRALRRFVRHRLPAFGPHEDAMMGGDPRMAHSMLSVPLNLGLLDPLEVVEAAEDAHRAGTVPLQSAEGFVRQVMGWRDYVWHLYWHLGEDYRHRNALAAEQPLPGWFADLDADAVDAACLADVLRGVRSEGWVHHIPRLMVLGNWALQRGYRPAEVTDWFHRAFVDGYDWVMVPNVVGMALHADGGVLATKPYVGGGAYIDRMSDYCGGCRYDPRVRVGEQACPFAAGYWWFLDRHREHLAGGGRMVQPLRGLDRLADLVDVVDQEHARGSAAP
ncbi:MAG TPA: cryptochrome/photolyase family protein [Jiangellales bacterium]|nr:cryptochrome/photolyase family protein [Jiangellales bacterium]